MRTSEIATSALQSRSEIQRMKKAVEVKALNGYRIWLRYADGVEGEVDLNGNLGGCHTAIIPWAQRR